MPARLGLSGELMMVGDSVDGASPRPVAYLCHSSALLCSDSNGTKTTPRFGRADVSLIRFDNTTGEGIVGFAPWRTSGPEYEADHDLWYASNVGSDFDFAIVLDKR